MLSNRETAKRKGTFIEVDELEQRSHVAEVARQNVGETSNALLGAEADALCQARRYERNLQRANPC